METITLLDNYLITNNEYESTLLMQILEHVKNDIQAIYMKERTGRGFSKNQLVEMTEDVKESVIDYVQGFDDTNAGEILLFLSNLPKIANEISENIEEHDEMSGINQISARDKVDYYMKNVFEYGYKTLYSNVDDKQIGVNLYYQCEKFIDALVLEFKQNLMPMIDKNNLVYDDIIYLRRHLINLSNDKENYSFVECNNCTREDCVAYTVCDTLSRVKAHEKLHKKYKQQIELLDTKLQNGFLSSEDYLKFGEGEDWSLIGKLVKLNPDTDNGNKQIQFTGHHKIFSVISAQRFEKILKRRYNGDAYEKDKDIYYMLRTGINPDELFDGDSLLEKVNDIHLAYSGNENSK